MLRNFCGFNPWNSDTLSSSQTISSRNEDIFSKIFVMGVLCIFKVLLHYNPLNYLTCKGYFFPQERLKMCLNGLQLVPQI